MLEPTSKLAVERVFSPLIKVQIYRALTWPGSLSEVWPQWCVPSGPVNSSFGWLGNPAVPIPQRLNTFHFGHSMNFPLPLASCQILLCTQCQKNNRLIFILNAMEKHRSKKNPYVFSETIWCHYMLALSTNYHILQHLYIFFLSNY